MKPPFPIGPPRLEGAKEHCKRARLVLRLANQQDDEKDAFRLRIVALSSCRAIIEVMLEAAEKQELVGFKTNNPKVDRDAYEATLAGLPHYKLIEHMRIHDFHRFGVIPPDKAYRAVLIGGPIKITAHGGGGSVVLGERGLEVATTGQSKVHLQRPLVTDDGKFLDEDVGRYYPPEAIAEAFLREVGAKLEEFERGIG